MLGGEQEDSERIVRTRNKIILNVGGLRHETYVGTLRNIPDTRLFSLTNNNPTQVPEFDPNSGEFFFDRHPLVFAQILNYYRTGKLHCPNDVCGPIFEEELLFWGLEDASIETCCWMNYKRHGEAQANLSSFDRVVEEATSEHEYSYHEGEEVGLPTRSYRQVLRKYKSRIWITLEEPSSSLTAKIIAMVSMLFIITSVITSCLETMEYFSESQSTQHRIIHICEFICIVWFTGEIIIRFVVCPSKRKFLKQIMNWLDLAAIVPFYVQLFLANAEINSIIALRIVRLIRVFRVFKLSRHSYSLQILGHTLRSSLSELFLLGFFLSIGVVIFSTLMYYAEHESKSKKFTSIPAGFWWAVVTMTTLGYGDIVPDTLPGKLVGAACAICGVLTIALPIPVIVSNFSLYYSHAKAKQKVSQRKRPLVIGAANALKVIDPFIGSRATNLRMSAMSENTSYVSPGARVRNWPKIALEMAGSSVDSSEPPASPTRRRLSKLPDKLWQFDQSRNFDNRKQGNLSKTTGEIPASEISKQHRRCSEDCTRNSEASSNLASKEHFQELAKCSDLNETNKCDGAYENKAIEQNSENENAMRTTPVTFDQELGDAETCSDEDNSSEKQYDYQQHSILPRIQIIRNSSASQMSGSNNEDETNENLNIKARKKKTKNRLKRSHCAVEKTTSAPSLAEANQGFSGKNLPGRMGRRGSVFVVGFLGKRWQAKAARSRKNRAQSKPEKIEHSSNKTFLLEISPSVTSRVSTQNEDSSRRTSLTSFTTPNSSISSKSNVFRFPGEQSFSESNFFRRSSCPNLLMDKIELHSLKNGNDKENNRSALSLKDQGKHEEIGSMKETISVDNKIGEALFDNKKPERDTKNFHDNIEDKECDWESNETYTKHVELDTKHHEGEKSSTGKASKLHINFNESNTELSEDTGTRLNSNESKGNRKSKQDCSANIQHSLSSTQSDSSLKVELEETVWHPSSPLIRQRAFTYFHGGGKRQDENESKDEWPTINHSSEQINGHCYHENATNSISDRNTKCDADMITKRSTITLMEIGKNRPETLNKANSKEGGSEKMLTSTVQKTSDDVNNWIKNSPQNSGVVTGGNTTAQSNPGLQRKKISAETLYHIFETKVVENNNTANEIGSEDSFRCKSDNRQAIQQVNDADKSSYQRLSENNGIRSTKSLQENDLHEEITSKKNGKIGVKSLTNRSLCEENGVKNQELLNESRYTDQRNASNFDQDYSGLNGIVNNRRLQNGGNNDRLAAKQPVVIQKNNRESKDEQTYGSIDLSRGRNETINVHRSLTNASPKSKRNGEPCTVSRSIWNDAVNSKYPQFYSRNLTHAGRHWRSLNSSISSHCSADQSTSFDLTMDGGTQRKVEAQDSGVYFSDYRSSIDSVSSFTEKTSDRGILKTISEVEHDYRDSMLYCQPIPGQYYEKSRSCALEIRDETAV